MLRILRSQRGNVSTETMGWLLLALVVVAIASSVFLPRIFNHLGKASEEASTKSYSVFSLSCPVYTLPAAVQQHVGGNTYEISLGNGVGSQLATRPSSHMNSGDGAYSARVPGGNWYICVEDNNDDGIPD